MNVTDKRLATMTLILTPKVVEEFGSTLGHGDYSETALNIYKESLERDFHRVVRATSVPVFEEKWNKAIVRYARSYDQILDLCATQLGPSRFKLEYVKQLSQVSKSFEHLSFASQNINKLFQKHVACSVNIATHYDDLFQEHEQELIKANFLLRVSNYGITLLALLLGGHLSGPLWMTIDVNHRISDVLLQTENLFDIPNRKQRLSGSLEFSSRKLNLGQSRNRT